MQVIDEQIKNIKIFESENNNNRKKNHNEMKKLKENLFQLEAYTEIELPEIKKAKWQKQL